MDQLDIDILIAADRLTNGPDDSVDGTDIADQLAAMGVSYNADIATQRIKRLHQARYFDQAFFKLAGGLHSPYGLMISEGGRAVAREADSDGFQRSTDEVQRLVSSDGFRAEFPGAYEAWESAEAALREPSSNANLQTVGHHLRTAQLRFATALVEAHDPPDVESDVEKVNKRVGAVIAMYRPDLGEKKRAYLEAMGTTWEATTGVIQRLVHAESKKNEPVHVGDARSATFTMLFLMFQLAGLLEDCVPEPNYATLETSAGPR
ncbi:MAG: hypothetical protein J0H98_00670 [Solirubrobacterales bacterium]|nr:hypothetical protein [Solirubrobacterales bacterium]